MKVLSSILFSLFALSLSAQDSLPEQYIFRVYLKDKGAVNYSVEKPLEFLTQTAIDRKKRQKAGVDPSDFPISSDYFHQMTLNNAKVVAFSKWFKTFSVQLNDSSQIAGIASLPFVDSVKYVWRGQMRNDIPDTRPRLRMPSCDEIMASGNPFGNAEAQFKLHNAQTMIQAGFRGKGINVAVIDAGFANVDVIPYFSRTNIVGAKSFVPTGHLFSASEHGTKVLSAMAINYPGIMMGSAAEANYLLLRSEDVRSEFPVEEDYWVRAIEYADSVGVDLVNTSLGYYSFDDKSLNYSHSQLTGRVSLMSLAADKAFDKGMIVVCSAGNEGAKPWGKVTSPGDAVNVLTVGAIGLDSTIVSFSSRGLTADRRIKPDVVSIGRQTVSIGEDGLLGHASGTSLSSPFFAGLVASLWSINPDLHRSRIIDIVRQSSGRYLKPDTVYGYGIPDFRKAMVEMLRSLPEHSAQVSDSTCHILPRDEGYVVQLQNPKFLSSFSLFPVEIINEKGELVLRANFENQHEAQIPFIKKEKGKALFFVLRNPLQQKIYKVVP
ncbi:MAG: S8 family serine peptidase [Dysgonamonadaceae bacterium]|jgi:subtilisin family serine protease|nr:S8 family serine peptidase [Dysgonamonadaceae bacterium]